RDGDRFQMLHHFFLAMLPPWREMKLCSEFGACFVAFKTCADIAAAFDENPAGAAAIHRMEVETVLSLRSIGVAEFFVDCLLLRKCCVVGAPEGDVVDSAGAKAPASRRSVRFMHQRNCLVRAAGTRFKAMISTVYTGLAEAKSLDEKALRLGGFAHGQH